MSADDDFGFSDLLKGSHVMIFAFCSQQQPEKSSAGSSGCMACLAGMCLCCCAEGKAWLSLSIKKDEKISWLCFFSQSFAIVYSKESTMDYVQYSCSAFTIFNDAR